MSVSYRVDFEGHDGRVIESFSNFLRLHFTRKASGIGDYSLDISGFDNRVDLIPDDAIMRVWMTDPAFDIPWKNIFNGIHKTFVDDVFQDGGRLWQSYGPTCEELLEKEIIAYPSGSAGADKTGVASTVMGAYVRENIGSLATTTNGRDYDGTNPVTVAGTVPAGPVWSGSRARKRLIYVIEGIYHDSIEAGDRIDFKVDYIGGYQFRFYAGKLGIDRTVDGLGDGHNRAAAPIILSPKYGNVRRMTRSKSRYNEANLAIALGQGEGSKRDFEVEKNTVSIAASPIAQRVATVNANREDSTNGLQDAAREVLDEMIAVDKYAIAPYKGTAESLVTAFPGLSIVNFTSEVLFRDYDLFDFVTIEDFRTGNRQDVQVVEYSGQIQASNTQIEVLDIKVRHVR